MIHSLSSPNRITRAKELAVIVGTKKALGIAIRHDVQAKRCSGLVERLAPI